MENTIFFAPAAQASPPPGALSGSEATLSGAGALRFFIVEDSPLVRGRLVEMLESLDRVVVVGEAARVPEAVEGILATRPDAGLLDLHLADGGEGLDVLRAVRALAPATEFIVLTNHSEPQYRRASAAAGAQHFLDKSGETHRIRQIAAELAAARP